MLWWTIYLQILDIAENYKYDMEILQLKIDIVKNRRKYLQRKIWDSSKECQRKEINKVNEAIRYYGVNKKTFGKEHRKHLGKNTNLIGK